PAHANGHAPPRTLEEAERAHILATMKETKWVLSGPKGAATRLGMNRSTLQFRMKRLGILRPAMCRQPRYAVTRRRRARDQGSDAAPRAAPVGCPGVHSRRHRRRASDLSLREWA